MVRRHGTLDGARCSAGCGDTVRLVVRGAARGRGNVVRLMVRRGVPCTRTELAAEIPELAADYAANSRISAANSVRAPAPRSVPCTRTELAAEIPKLAAEIPEFQPLIRYGYWCGAAYPVPAPN